MYTLDEYPLFDFSVSGGSWHRGSQFDVSSNSKPPPPPSYTITNIALMETAICIIGALCQMSTDYSFACLAWSREVWS